MILILGGNGYVAKALARACERGGLAHRVLSRSECCYTSESELRGYLQKLKPDCLINAAGYTGFPNVAASENRKGLTLEANTSLPAMLSRVCGDLGLRWGHVSTGCIYHHSGPDVVAFTEDAPANFTFRHPLCSFYSGTKALAEEILAGDERVTIWRIRRPFNEVAEPKNTLRKLLSYPMLVDLANSYSQIDEAADAMLHCMVQEVPCGIYNLTNPGWVDGRTLVRLAMRHGVIDREPGYVSQCSELPGFDGVPRAECVLDSGKIMAAGAKLSPLQEALEKALKNWHGGC